jgi:hypothetical protein
MRKNNKIMTFCVQALVAPFVVVGFLMRLISLVLLLLSALFLQDYGRIKRKANEIKV